MPLNLYLAVSYEGDGKDDTSLLVRASNVEEAARIADEHLSMMPFPHCEPLCNRVIELGIDGTEHQEPGIIAGQMKGMAHGFIGYKCWMREIGWCDTWRDVKEVFGE